MSGAPPDIDPNAVTAADVSSALAGFGGDHDDADGAPGQHARVPWLAMDDWPAGVAPPDAPARHVR
jgi:hypothetical protein